MFDGYHSLNAMFESVYSLHLNVGYTHSFSDNDLNSTLEKLVDDGLVWHKIQADSMLGRDFYTLSEKGGSMWECERSPDWNSYVLTLQKQLGVFANGSQMIYCVDESIGRRCAGAMFASGLVSPIGSLATRKVFKKRLIPWKTFDCLYAIRFATKDSIHHSSRCVDWKTYDSSKCWWRDLIEFKHAPICPAYKVAHIRARNELNSGDE